jgi:hypothetical protein
MYNADSTTDGTGSYAMGGTPVAGQWTHLLGVYDVATKQISLYVNGVLVSTVSHTPVWGATGPLAVGRALSGGVAMPWQGQVADVVAYNRVAVSDDLWGSDFDATTGKPAAVGLLAAQQVGLWDFSGGGDCFPSCVDSPNLAGMGAPNTSLTLDPGSLNATPTSWFAVDDHDGNDGAVGTDGVSGYSATTNFGDPANSGDDVSQPVVRTDQSFTVSAWVKLGNPGDALPDRNEAVVVEDGVHVDGFVLGYHGSDHTWGIWTHVQDQNGTAEAGHAIGSAAPQTGVWTMLTGVYDTGTTKLYIYVNGQLAGSTAVSAAPTWTAGGSLVLGRELWAGAATSFLAGSVDQVHVYVGAMSAREVADLYNGVI